MPPTSESPPEKFDDLLAWLDPDRELASSVYLNLRQSLLRIFAWNRCADPEGMTDETFDRVLRQVHTLVKTYEGNPKLFFYGVANNLIKEYRKKIKSYVSIEGIELAEDPPQEFEEETSEKRSKCLSKCLRKLPKPKRDLILGYYAKEKQAKIVHRAEMARQLGISMETLRVRMLRIRKNLEECIELCLDEGMPKNETD
ncbi:MAG TPA: sigma-70 family RNA polymerase sigma factor [Pyrinomonadaceae bacterium]|nr:sigma-70 family RNA polymerase sigma factor [Pyrinomonadaceae bacterium]